VRCGKAPRSRFDVQDDRDGAIVHELDGHAGAEDAAFDVDAELFERNAEPVVAQSRAFRTSLAVSSSSLLGRCEELGEYVGERLRMGQRSGVPGAGDLLHPCVGDAVGHVPRAGGQERLGVRPVQHQHRS
jgi:hypothetical protein